jgi:hypothetical protein
VFLPVGIEHMLLGCDHVLFIAGVVLLAGELRRFRNPRAR